MTFPQTLTTRFFQLINNHQHAEAQRELQRIKQKMQKTEWNHGYYRALIGMLHAQRPNNNQYTFLQNINPNDKTQIKQYKYEFQKHIQSRFQEDFDRGYFSAWHDYTRILIRIIDETKPKTNPEGQTSITHYAETTPKPA